MEKTVQTFKIPESDRERSELVWSIPAYWSEIMGTLYAPSRLYEEDKIAKTTQFFIERASSHEMVHCYKGHYDTCFEDTEEPISRERRDHSDLEPDMNGISDGKLPSSVNIGYGSGYFDDEHGMRIVIDSACQFIQKGYKGSLWAFAGKNGSMSGMVYSLGLSDWKKNVEFKSYTEVVDVRLALPIINSIRNLKLEPRDTVRGPMDIDGKTTAELIDIALEKTSLDADGIDRLFKDTNFDEKEIRRILESHEKIVDFKD